MPVIDVVSDASVALKWFHERGEGDVAQARELLDHQRTRRVVLHVLDLTHYEVGNALMHGHAQANAEQIATVLAALRQVCRTITPDDQDLALAADLGAKHHLTLYDAAYAAVARLRRAPLVTFDRQLINPGLGVRPDHVLGGLT